MSICTCIREYSLLDGACRVEELAQRAKELGQTALADHGPRRDVRRGRFLQRVPGRGHHARSSAARYTLRRAPRFDREHGIDDEYSHLILLCKNDDGLPESLLCLSPAALRTGFYIKPRIDWALLHEHAEGLICLSGCLAGYLSRHIVADDYEGAKAEALGAAASCSARTFTWKFRITASRTSARPRSDCAACIARNGHPARRDERRALC